LLKTLLLGLVVLSGCAAAGTETPNLAGRGICPNHPEQCGGSCCGERCVDTSGDPANCGGCGRTCAAGLLCQGGSCGCAPSGIACGAGQMCCAQDGCKSLDSDVNNCGSCGHVCGGSGASCVSGQCTCGGQTCGQYETCCNGSCAASCAPDLGMPTPLGGTGGLCQCGTHCAGDPIGWCMGTDCCYLEALGGACQIGPCLPNMTP
jgi:hypothetical protein